MFIHTPKISDDGTAVLVQQDVVAVEVAVDDGLGQGVQVVHAPRHVQRNSQLGMNVYQPDNII